MAAHPEKENLILNEKDPTTTSYTYSTLLSTRQEPLPRDSSWNARSTMLLLAGRFGIHRCGLGERYGNFFSEFRLGL